MKVYPTEKDEKEKLLEDSTLTKPDVDVQLINDFSNINFNGFLSKDIGSLKETLLSSKSEDEQIELESLCSIDGTEEGLFTTSITLDDNVKKYLAEHDCNILPNISGMEDDGLPSQLKFSYDDKFNEFISNNFNISYLKDKLLLTKDVDDIELQSLCSTDNKEEDLFTSSLILDDAVKEYLAKHNCNILQNSRDIEGNPSTSQIFVGVNNPLLHKQNLVTVDGITNVGEFGIKVAEDKWLSDVHRVINLQLCRKQWGTYIFDIQGVTGDERWGTEISEIERNQETDHDWNTSIQEIYGEALYKHWSMSIADNVQNKELPRHWSSTINDIEKVGKCKSKWSTVFRKINKYFPIQNEWKTTINSIEKRPSKDKWKFRLANNTIC